MSGKIIAGIWFERYDTGGEAEMSLGIGKDEKRWKEPREYYFIYCLRKDNTRGRLLVDGSTNATTFLSKRYGHGIGRASTDKQIVDAVLNDESIFDY